LIRLGVRTRVGGYCFLEEDAEDGDGSGDDCGCGFDAGPDGEFFAVVGEVFLAELDHVDAFYYGADTGSGGSRVSTAATLGSSAKDYLQYTHAHGDAHSNLLTELQL